MARTSLKTLLGALIEQVKASPVPIRSIELDGTKIKRVEFAPPPGTPEVTQTMGGERPAPPKYVSGTEILDDGTPLNPLDTMLNPATYEVEAEE